MCDYSLHAYSTRLAAEGETLVATRFSGGSIGFASPSELENRNSWDYMEGKPLTAVCIPPGARLVLEEIPAHLQQELGVAATEVVTFTQRTYEAYTHRDAVRFDNGREVLIQRLAENQHARVLWLSKPVEPVERVHEEVLEPVGI